MWAKPWHFTEVRYNELMVAFNTATPVVNKIAAIGEVTYPTSNDKIDAARKMCESITAENSESMLDLKKRIETLYSEIQKWN